MHELLFLGSVAALYFPVLLSPGPNFLVLTKVAGTESRRHGMATALGISSASILYSMLAVTGVGLLVVHSRHMQDALRLAGGTYLLYKGLGMMRPVRSSRRRQDDQNVRQGGLAQAYCNGMLTNLTNPQALVFFTSVFATLLSADLRPWAKPASVAVVAASSLSVNVATVFLFSLASVQRRYLLAKAWIDRVSGILLAAFGMNLMRTLWQ
jgi:threonine/homoserine/homoserine lactone efflux protein